MSRENKNFNYEDCYCEAKKYNNRSSFKIGNYSAFLVSVKNGWIEDYEWFHYKIRKGKNYWTYEKCYEAALECKTRTELSRKFKTAYENSRINGWLDDYVWLENKQFDLFEDKIDSVYCYEFYLPNNKAVYVGRTLMKLQKSRDYSHIFTNDSVSEFAKKNNTEVPEMKILEENLTLKEGVEKEGFWVKFYREQGWEIINKAKTGSIGGLGQKWSRFNYEVCYEEAKKYKTRKEFANNSNRAYTCALKNKWLDDYTWFKPQKELLSERFTIWSYEICYNEAKKYEYLTDFSKNSQQAYSKSLKMKWLKDYFWLKKKRKEWNYETVKEESLKYISIHDFRQNSSSAYGYAYRHGLLEDFEWLSKPNKWDYDSCYVTAQKYNDLKTFRDNEGSCYGVALSKGWINEYTWLKRRFVYEYVYCFEIAKQYETKTEFREKSRDVYDAALRKGWMKDYTWLKEEVYEITEEDCEREARKYTTIKEFKEDSPQFYRVSVKKRLLKNFDWFKHENKLIWTKEACYKEASKYTKLKDFVKNCSAAYNSARKHSWLKEYTWLEKTKIKWNKEKCESEAKKFTTVKEFREKSITAYVLSCKKGWNKDYYWLKNESVIYTKELCESEAKKYTLLKDFRINSKPYYNASRKKNWLKDYTWLIAEKKQSKIQTSKYWTEDKCLEESKKYTTKQEFEKQNPKAYKVAKRNKWLNNYVWLSSYKKERKWTYETCKMEAEKYITKIAFRRGSNTAYQAAQKNGWLKDFTWFKKESKYDYQTCYEIASKYKTTKEFVENEKEFYNAANRNGWLNDYVWLKKGHKPNGYWEDYEICYQEALKYKTLKEFSSLSAGCYNSAKKNGWIEDYTWLEHCKNKCVKKGTWKNYDVCYIEAQKYKTINELKAYASGCYASAYKNGWLKDYTWLYECEK